MKRTFCLLAMVFFAAQVRAARAEEIPTKVSCDTIKNAYGTIDSALGDKKRGVGKPDAKGGAGAPAIPGLPGGIPGMGQTGGAPGQQPKGQPAKPAKEVKPAEAAQDGSAEKQPAKKKAKKKKAEPVSEYRFKQETVSDSTYKFDKRANPIIKDAKPKKKAKKKVVKEAPPPEEPAPVDGPPIPQKKLPAQPPQEEFID